MTRFSDEQLTELRQDFEQHKEEQERRWGELAEMVKKNTMATERIAEAVEKQAESTAGLVQLYTDFKGAARIGAGVQKFLIKLAATGSAGVAVGAGIAYLIDKLSPSGTG